MAIAALEVTITPSQKTNYINIISGVSTFDGKSVTVQNKSGQSGLVTFATSSPTSGGDLLQHGQVTPKTAITAGDGIWINAQSEGVWRIREVS